jgi:hypothetical protein
MVPSFTQPTWSEVVRHQIRRVKPRKRAARYRPLSPPDLAAIHRVAASLPRLVATRLQAGKKQEPPAAGVAEGSTAHDLVISGSEGRYADQSATDD